MEAKAENVGEGVWDEEGRNVFRDKVGKVEMRGEELDKDCEMEEKAKK